MGPSVRVNTLNNRFEGGYRVAAVSGLITGIANAGDGTHGHIFAMRWAPTTAGTPKPNFAVIQRLRARLTTITGYTSAQEVGIDLIVARSYSAAHTGGTALTMTTNNAKKKTSQPLTQMTMQVATTGELTAGTQTFDAQPISQAIYAELAAAATVQKGFAEILMTDQDLDRFPFVLAANEGLVVRSTIAQGTGGTARLVVEVDWLEVQRY